MLALLWAYLILRLRRLIRSREFGRLCNSLRNFPRVRCHASALLLPGSIAPAPHLTSPLCCHKAQRRAVRGAELSFIVSILSTAVFSRCVHLITTNEFALYNTYYLPYVPNMNSRLDKAFFLHVLILIIEVHVQTQGFYVQRSCRSRYHRAAP